MIIVSCWAFLLKDVQWESSLGRDLEPGLFLRLRVTPHHEERMALQLCMLHLASLLAFAIEERVLKLDSCLRYRKVALLGLVQSRDLARPEWLFCC